MKIPTLVLTIVVTIILRSVHSFQLPRPSVSSAGKTRSEPTSPTEQVPPRHQHRHSLLTQLAKISANGADDKDINMTISLVGSTTSALVSITFFCVLAWQRDAIMVTFFIGSILNGFFSKVLKKLINESRPPELETVDMTIKPSDGGMPSSHAMSLGFIGVFTALSLPWTRLPLGLYILISLYYRVAVNLHTIEQIAVGLVLGTAHGTLWFQFCHGASVFGINPKDFVASHFLNEQGILPWPALVVPVIVGAAVVGSFERRISKWLQEKQA